jgi:hypothetical protein
VRSKAQHQLLLLHLDNESRDEGCGTSVLKHRQTPNAENTTQAETAETAFPNA